MRRYSIIAMIAALAACKDTAAPASPNGAWSLINTWAGQVIITENTDHPRWPADQATIREAAVVGDSLELFVTFGGGCREHSFLLLADGAWMESYPVQVGVKLSHQANGDNCKALLSRVLRFDLTPLKVAYNRSYQTSTGIIAMNIRGFGSVRYSW